mmetsp:Transcript_59802/g.112452  ORF Transcript_59802/g.112452 Transcript_59802/m.112452 type:complete len:209 (+) Transcript_59802:496-1122(+)
MRSSCIAVACFQVIGTKGLHVSFAASFSRTANEVSEEDATGGSPIAFSPFVGRDGLACCAGSFGAAVASPEASVTLSLAPNIQPVLLISALPVCCMSGLHRYISTPDFSRSCLSSLSGAKSNILLLSFRPLRVGSKPYFSMTRPWTSKQSSARVFICMSWLLSCRYQSACSFVWNALSWNPAIRSSCIFIACSLLSIFFGGDSGMHKS